MPRRRRKSPIVGVLFLAVAALVVLNPAGVGDWAIGQYTNFWIERGERQGERIQEGINEQLQRMQTPTPSATATP